MGAWIETRGYGGNCKPFPVAPRVGAWIETHQCFWVYRQRVVAPRVGAWIETAGVVSGQRSAVSHPVWVRGLKHLVVVHNGRKGQVAPRVGAWIETWTLLLWLVSLGSRTPCGCVD